MNDFYDLLEQAHEYLKEGNSVPDELVSKIRNTVNAGGYIGMAQINSIAGDIEYNAGKIAKYINFSNKIGLEAVIFPELSIPGFPLQDILKRHPVVASENVKWLKGLAGLTGDTVVITGFIEPAENENKYYNSLAVMQYGKIQCIIRKHNINTSLYGYDEKYYSSYSGSNIFMNKDKKYGLYIGDDLDASTIQNDKPDLIINPSVQSLFRNPDTVKILSSLSKEHKIPCVFVNGVGANDNIMFDGTSCAYNERGQLFARAKAYEEQFMIINPYNSTGKIYPAMSVRNKDEFSLDYEDDLERTYKALVLGVKDYFSKCGFKRAVLGLSGGLDSTVCAVILADALGKENVFGISMPSHITSSESKSDAEQLANNLGINFAVAPIRSMFDTTSDCFNTLFEKVEAKWGKYYDVQAGTFNNKPKSIYPSYTPDNIQARSRAMYLWGVSNEFESCIPIATSDKSEAYMGYATINGDMSGGFAPIADITKTKLFALARWLNKNRAEKNSIPESVINKRPGAELAINPKTGKPLIAEDALMPYDFLDEIIWRIENKKQGYNELLNTTFVYEKNNNITHEQKAEWLNKFYRRMSTAFYKWSIMPPFVMVEHNSINKCDYSQPITSSHINYKGVDEEYINSALDLS